MAQLTTGRLKRVIHEGETLDLTVQIVAYKSIKAPGSADDLLRYRLTLSDGVNSYGACIHSSPAALDLSGLPVITIASDQYSFSEINKENQKKRIMIISSFDMQFKPNSQLGEAQLTPMDESILASSKGVDGKIEASMDTTETRPMVAVQRAPAVSKQTVMPNSGKVPNAPGGSLATHTHPIKSLNPYQNKWRIRARVTAKGDIRTWSNARGEGKLFSVDLRDESSEIRATAFKEQCDKFYNVLTVGNVYFISGGVIKQARKEFTSIKNDYEIAFTQSTEITPCLETSDVGNIPKHMFHTVSIDKLPAHVNESVDLMGILKSTGDVTSVIRRSDQSSLEKRDVVIIDKDLNSVTLTLWGEKAADFSPGEDEHPVIAIRNANVKEFGGGISLGVSSSSTIEFNPDTTMAHDLLGWWAEMGGDEMQLKDYSARREGVGSGDNIYRLIGAAEALDVGDSESQADYFNIKAQITSVRTENAIYKSCIKAGCKKKVTEIDGDMGMGKKYRCEKCQEEFDSHKYQFMTSMELCDMTGTKWVTCFGDIMQQLMGKSADELGALRERSEDEYQKQFGEITFVRHLFRVRAKTEFYQDERRVKWTVQAVRPYDPALDIPVLNDTIAKFQIV